MTRYRMGHRYAWVLLQPEKSIDLPQGRDSSLHPDAGQLRAGTRSPGHDAIPAPPLAFQGWWIDDTPHPSSRPEALGLEADLSPDNRLDMQPAHSLPFQPAGETEDPATWRSPVQPRMVSRTELHPRERTLASRPSGNVRPAGPGHHCRHWSGWAGLARLVAILGLLGRRH